METINKITTFLKNEKEAWDRDNDIKFSFKDIQTKLSHKASSWITFQDGSGEIKIYEENSIPYSEDLDIAGVGRDIILGGTSLFVPVVGTWIAGGIIGLRGSKIISGAFTGLAWKNTYIFIFDKLKKCVLALEIHYAKSNNFMVVDFLKDIEGFVETPESEIYEEE